MNLFDVMGPVMVGPSSSHTAGAVRIGRIARRLLSEGTPEAAEIALSGSFAATGRGHGTDRALIAGLLGMKPDDERIPDSFAIAREAGMAFSFEEVSLPGAHPNTARLHLTGKSGKGISVTASSLGGGRIEVVELGDLRVSFSGDLSTLIVQNRDLPGYVSDVTNMLAHREINIASMHLYRDYPGGTATMVIEVDKPVPREGIEQLHRIEGIVRVTFIPSDNE